MTGKMGEAELAAVLESARPRVRTPVAILVKRLPPRDQTHLLREIDELERQGQPVVLVPLLAGPHSPVEEERSNWFRRYLSLPLFSLPILVSILESMVRQPVKLLRVVVRLALATILRPMTMLRTFPMVPKAIHLARELERVGVQHVHAHAAAYPATAAWIIGSLSNLTWSFTAHGPDIFVHRLLLRRKIATARFVRSVSGFNKAFLSGLYPSIISDKIHVVPMGVNHDQYDTRPPQRDAAALPVILSVASLMPNKGFGFLIEACAALLREGVGLECRIVGDGPLRARLQEAIEEHGLTTSVRLLGLLPQEEVIRQLHECDLFVLPGTISLDGQMDGTPVSLVEAMAAGRPVIAPAISGIPELINDGITGILVDSTHPDRIVDAMRRLIQDPALRERMGAAGQRRVRDSFDIRTTAAAMVDLFDRHDRSDEKSAESIAALDIPELRGAAVAVRAVHERNDSSVAELSLMGPAGRRELVVKRHRSRPGESRPPDERARHEFDVLRMLETRFAEASPGEPCRAVPHASSFHAQQAVVVMERASGQPLDSVIRKLRTHGSEEELAHSIRRAGEWLDAMQRATLEDEDGRHLLTAVTLLALRDLDLASAADHQLLRSRSWIGLRLRALEAQVADRPLGVVGHHGDYWPGNIFIADERVEVIDFEGYREGLEFEDVAWFLIHLQFSFMFPPFHRRFPRLERAFLDGYRGADAVDSDTLHLLTAAKALQVLARGKPAARDDWRTWWLRRTLRKTIFRSLA